MNKIITLFVILLFNIKITSQAPANYYNGTAGLTGAALKTQLHYIISNGHIDQGYSGLWTGYLTTDRDYFYENDGTVLDLYSENPNGTDPYNYTPNLARCGNYTNEGDCYNREHIVPQSFFNEQSPMKNDIHFVRPTDGKVNGMRSNFPFGKVGTASWTSLNGSKIGNSISAGYGGTVFEPIDAFKGDVARMVFYFVTRYQNQIPSFSTGNMLESNTFPSLQNWQLQQLLAWHSLDPVSPMEIARNNASYAFQGNRNPFIDNPQWVNDIWGSPDTTPPTVPSNLVISNPTTNSLTLSWSASTDNVAVDSYNLYMNGILHSTVNSSTLSKIFENLSSNTTYTFYIIAKDTSGNTSVASSSISGTTLPAVTPPSGSEIYISEYVEGSGYNKAIEITNPTNNTIDMSMYSIQKQSNGAGSWVNPLALVGNLAPGQTYIIRNSSSTFSCTFTANQSSGAPMDFNGNDPIGLFKNGVLIDIVGNFNGGTANFGAEVTLRRKVVGPSGNFNLLEWDSFPQNSCDNLGIPNPGSMSTKEVFGKENFILASNPITNNTIQIIGNQLNKIKYAEIYGVDGKLIQVISNPFSNKNTIEIVKLPKGNYILKTDAFSTTFLVK